MKLLHEIIVPHETVNDEKVVIVKLCMKEGSYVKKGDLVLEIETSKAAVTIEAEEDGYIFFNCAEGDEVIVGSVVAELFDENKPLQRAKREAQAPKVLKTSPAKSTVFSRKALDLLSSKGIDQSVFSGWDFVRVHDVESYLNKSTSVRLSHKNPINIEESAPTTSEPKDKRERIVVACPSMLGMEVIWDILQGQPNKEIIGYVADDQYKAGLNLPMLECNVFDFPRVIKREKYDTVIIAMSGSLKSMQFRKMVFEKYRNEGITFTNLISKRANIGINVHIGTGNIIGSGVFIGTGTAIGDNNFISYMTTIGHHNVIGDNNLFAPGVTMSGLVEVGNDCILTTGINFIDKVKIGNRVILPLGYNVVSNLPDDTVIKIRS